jgi:multicomponent Na+:H+ antiporter subunit G
MIWVVQVFLLMGIVFSILGNLGVLIFPDVYTRLQASSTCSTTSVFSIFIAAMLSAGFSPLSGKILVITLFFLISSPVSSYIVARFAWNKEIIPWRKLKPHQPGFQETEK